MGRVLTMMKRWASPGAPRCPGCAYDTAGLERDRCPECGGSLRPAWRLESPGPGSVLRRRTPVVASLLIAVMVASGIGVAAGMGRVMLTHARHGAVTTSNLAAAGLAAGLSILGLVAAASIVAQRHRIAHGPACWFWFGASMPIALLALGLLAWAAGEAFLPGP